MVIQLADVRFWLLAGGIAYTVGVVTALPLRLLPLALRTLQVLLAARKKQTGEV